MVSVFSLLNFHTLKSYQNEYVVSFIINIKDSKQTIFFMANIFDKLILGLNFNKNKLTK